MILIDHQGVTGKKTE
ncbi:hypothetical protein [Paenibacillus monticola]